jgi:tetratricopeptide (TPR) repeat protein
MLKSSIALSLAVVVAVMVGAPAMASPESAFQANSFVSAETEAKAQLKKNPADPEANAWLARSLYKQGRFAAAEAALKKAGTSNVEALVAHGDYEQYVGNSEGAIAFYTKALAQAPKNVAALVGLASAHLNLEHFDKAYDLADQAEGLAGGESAYMKSRVYAVLGGAQGLKANKGGLGDKLKYGPRVKTTLEKAVDVAPQNANAQYALGRFYLLAPGLIGGNPGKSVGYLERATQLEPYFYPAQAWLVRAYVETGKKDNAARELAEFKRKFSSLPEAMREISDIKL